MKKLTFFLALVLFFSYGVNAQKSSVKTKTLKEVITLEITREGGGNGGGVAWHPGQSKYYAAMAGNKTFPMEIFDKNGNNLPVEELETMVDVRGLWYNPKSKALQANSYNNLGVAEYNIDSKGKPLAVKELIKDVNQPDPQCIAVYDAKNDLIYFYDYESVTIESRRMRDGSKHAPVALHLGVTTKGDIDDSENDDLKEYYNENAIIFTGIASAEIGLLNVEESRIELYNIANGLMTRALALPDDAPVQPVLNFSYANGLYWLFDKEERVWHGYGE